MQWGLVCILENCSVEFQGVTLNLVVQPWTTRKLWVWSNWSSPEQLGKKQFSVALVSQETKNGTNRYWALSTWQAPRWTLHHIISCKPHSGSQGWILLSSHYKWGSWDSEKRVVKLRFEHKIFGCQNSDFFFPKCVIQPPGCSEDITLCYSSMFFAHGHCGWNYCSHIIAILGHFWNKKAITTSGFCHCPLRERALEVTSLYFSSVRVPI